VVLSVEQLADDLIALMRKLGISDANLVGHSTGGAIAMVVAARAPELVRSLVLYASVHRADAYRRRVWGLRKLILQELGPEVYSRTTSLFFYPPEYVAQNDTAEQRAAAGEIPSAEIQASRIDAILNFECVEPLSSLKVPTLVYCAEDDMLTPAYFSREIASLIPGAKLELLPRGGHAFSRSRSDVFNEKVLDFLGTLSANAIPVNEKGVV
jgi:aminoacrylate hydrolase